MPRHGNKLWCVSWTERMDGRTGWDGRTEDALSSTRALEEDARKRTSLSGTGPSDTFAHQKDEGEEATTRRWENAPNVSRFLHSGVNKSRSSSTRRNSMTMTFASQQPGRLAGEKTGTGRRLRSDSSKCQKIQIYCVHRNFSLKVFSANEPF